MLTDSTGATPAAATSPSGGTPAAPGTGRGDADCRATLLLMAAVLILVTNSALSPALPAIERLFSGTSDADLKARLLITAPSLAAAIAAPIAGLIADRFGRRRQLLVGVLLFALAGSAGLYLPSLEMIVASRCVLGVAVAMILTSQISLLGDYFVGGDRTRQLGFQFGGAHLASAIILLLAGALALMSPRLPFALYLLSLALLPVMRRGLADIGPDRFAGSDPAAGLRGAGWSVAVVLIAATIGAGMAIVYLLPTELPFVVEGADDASPFAFGAILAGGLLIAGLLTLSASPLRTRFGLGTAIAIGLAVMAGGFALLSRTTQALPMALGIGATFGGFGLFVTYLDSLALDLAPPTRRGLAMGLVNMALFLGQVASPLALHGLVGDLGLYQVLTLAATLTLIAAVVTGLGMHSYEGRGDRGGHQQGDSHGEPGSGQQG